MEVGERGDDEDYERETPPPSDIEVVGSVMPLDSRVLGKHLYPISLLLGELEQSCVFYCHLKTYCGPSSETIQSPE